MIDSPQDINHQPTQRYLGTLSAPQIGTLLSRDSVLCLPTGSYEQHGPHLPVYTDAILAERFAQEVTARWGGEYDVWRLPTIPFGLAPEHAWSRGTFSLPIRSFVDYMLGFCEAVAIATPARNLLIVNYHGGNRGILEALVYEIESRIGLNVCVTHPSALAGVRSGSPIPDVHGGMSETSVMLALAEQDVHLEALDASYDPSGSTLSDIQQLIIARGTTWAWTSDDPSISMLGIVGDARGANADLGRRIVDQALEAYGLVLARLVKRGVEKRQT